MGLNLSSGFAISGALLIIAVVVLALTGHCSGGAGFNVGIR